MSQPSLALPSDLEVLLPKQLKHLCQSCEYGNGDLVFNVSRVPEHMFYVAQGEVRLLRHSESGELVILQRAQHCFLAEASLSSASYHCDAQAVGRVTAFKIPIAAIRQALQSDPMFALAWINMLNLQIRQLRLQ
jgi:CRP/FNR family transcriptional regulator, dissimilatory nitrate respiration regulator